MKRLLIVALACAALTACTSDQVNKKVTQVQAATAAACKFIPTASAVGAILSAGNPIVATVGGAASAICAAIQAAPKLGLFSADKPDCVVVVEGICVDGEFVEEGK